MAIIQLIKTRRIKRSDIPLVIGYFNCIHTMHVELLTKYHNYNVLTFKDFPSKRNNTMYSFKERIDNIEKYKPENIYVLDLNKNNMTALDFVLNVLKNINPSDIVVGEDFKFGSDHQDVNFLKNYYHVDTIKYNSYISTSKIVSNLKKGKLDDATNYLDEPYYFVSKWVSGNKIGRKIGFRTINLIVDKRILVPEGAYVSITEIGNKKYKSISFVGTSDLNDPEKLRLETHILDKKIKPRIFHTRLTRNNVKVSFLKMLRKNKSFTTKRQLQLQLCQDKEQAIKYFKENI